MMMPGRTYSAQTGYRYGFNGKENDNEVKGEGNQQDYGMRIYDPRLGRFLSTDPLSKSFPWYSPYQFAGNMPIAAIDLDGEEQKIMINWHDVNGKVTQTKIVKGDFNDVNKLWQSLGHGLNKETTYTLEGTKFNANNAQFTSGFEAYKKGTLNYRNPRNPSIRPNNGTLTFDISTDAKGNQLVKINFDNAPINEKELFADAIRGASKVTNVVGSAIEGLGYITLQPELVAAGKGVSSVGDIADAGADFLEGKAKEGIIKVGTAAVNTVIKRGIDKIPTQKLGREAIDTYVSRGTGTIKDAVVNSIPRKVEESDKLDIKIETTTTTNNKTTSNK
jgi:RHS repeat-associated protein